MTKLKPTLIALLIIFFSGYQLFASDPITIEYGTNLQGMIVSKGEKDIYTFHADAGDAILIRMRDITEVDAHITLYKPNGQAVTSDFDYGGLAEIRGIILNESGLYKIEAQDKNNNDVGIYGLSLHKLNDVDYATPISSFISFEDEITKNCEVKMYSFEAEAGDVIYAELRAETTHFEGDFFIYNDQGHEQFHSGKQGRRQVVGPVSIGNAGTYTIAVMDHGGNDVDEFGFTLNTLNRHELVEPLACSDNRALSLDQLVHRRGYRIDSGVEIAHFVETMSNDPSIELCLEIYDEYGAKIHQEVHTKKRSHKYIDQYNSSNSYLVVVFDEHGNDLGDFGLQAHTMDESECTEILGCEDITETLQFANLAGSKAYFIEGTQGQSVNVTLKEMTNISTEPELRLYSKYGALIAEESSATKADMSDFTFPYDDSFILIASDDGGNDIGEFQLICSGSEFDVELEECQMVYYGFVNTFNTAQLEVTSNQNNLNYTWSTGQSGSSIQVSPSGDTEYQVTVTNTQGCEMVLTTFVEVQNVHCGNGNNIKVEVCHVKSNGNHQQKCISENGVWAHLNNGNGHEDCYLGACNYISMCEDQLYETPEDNLFASPESDIETRNPATPNSNSSIAPNPTNDYFTIQLDGDHKAINILNIQGGLLNNIQLQGDEQSIEINMKDYEVPPGMYFVQVLSEHKMETHRLIYIQ